MRNQILFFFFLISFVNNVFGQSKDACNCSVVLKEVITDIEANYPGYQTKVKGSNHDKYEQLRAKVIEQANSAASREKCFYIIEYYIRFFKDNHILFTDRTLKPSQATLKSKQYDVHPDKLSGVWQRNSDSLKIRIVKDLKSGNSATYKAFIVDAGKTGNIHFELIGNADGFKIRKYNSYLTTDLQRGRILNNLLIEPEGIWKKITSAADDMLVKTSAYSRNTKFRYEPISTNIYYIGIPSFTTDETKFDSLIVNIVIPHLVDNKVENLIVDLRNNAGGNSSFLSLLRLIYEKPFSVPGDFLYASPKLIEKYKASGSSYRQLLLPRLQANTGKFVQRDSLKIALKKSYEYPKVVSLIVNENSASSSEYFLILAKKSSKVKVYGRNTSGTLDYSEILEPEKLPCPGYSFMRPTTKSYWTDTSPIDNIGIKPDVDLTGFPDNEWVERVVDEYLK